MHCHAFGFREAIGVAFLGAFAAAGGCGERALFPNTNLILVTVDTMRADHIGGYGYAAGRTPNLDRFASEGVLFSEMLSAVPLTLPSHTTFLTGAFPYRHGVHDNGAFRLDAAWTTLAEYLAGAGYRTAAFVSSFQLESKYGLAQGFDEYDDRMPDAFSIYDRRIAAGPRAEQIIRHSRQRRAGEITALVRAWIDRGGSEPFFLWLHYFDPHETYDPPPPFDRLYPDRAYPDSLYDGEITFFDHEFGNLIDLLRERGLYGRTLVFLGADHGEGLGDHGEMYHDTFLYNSTLRIPFLVGGGAAPPSWPSIVSRPVRSVDVLPTILDAAGVDPRGTVDGKSLFPLLRGGARREGWWSYCETYSPTHNLCAKLFGIRTEKWKYIEAAEPELYDLEADPGEKTNLVRRRADVAERMRGRLRGMIPGEETGRIEIDAQTKARLAAIGYVDPGSDAIGSHAGDDPKEMAPCIDGLHRSMRYFTIGAYDSSLAVLQRLRIEYPGQSQIYDNIANLEIRLGRFDELIRDFTGLTQKYPQYAKGDFWLGLASLRTGQNEEALAWFREAVRRAPAMQSAYYQIGLTLGRMKRASEALEAWEAAIRIDPESETGRLARQAHDGVRDALDRAGVLPSGKNLSPGGEPEADQD